MSDARQQLADELDAIEFALLPFTGIRSTGIISPAHVAGVVAELAQVDDDRLAAEAYLSVMSALWPHCAPEQCGRAEWWQTPLGRLCARVAVCDDSEPVTHSVAAAMLGMATSSIGVMIQRGNLKRHPNPKGGVLRSSIMARLCSPASTVGDKSPAVLQQIGRQP